MWDDIPENVFQESLEVVEKQLMKKDKKEKLRPNRKNFISRPTPKQVKRSNKHLKKLKLWYETECKEQFKLTTNSYRINIEKKSNGNTIGSSKLSLRNIV